MYEMKYITLEQENEYKALIAKEDKSIKNYKCYTEKLKDAVKTLLEQVEIMGDKAYDPDFGDARLCTCGHVYYRHFDPFEGYAPVGCKYCFSDQCIRFTDSGKTERWEDGKKIIEENNER